MASIDYTGKQFGEYRLLRNLGGGGFADVYLGENTELNSPDGIAAIKVLKTQLRGKEVDKFREEALTLWKLRHPNIVRVLAFKMPTRTMPPYIVMEYASHGTLLTKFQGTPQPPSTILSYIKQVADALQYIHGQNLMHLDITPQNILLRSNDEALLSDFGIAMAIQSIGQPGTKGIYGNPAYTAPERLQRKPCFASDQYSLGIVVYELLSGACPFEGSTGEIMRQQLSDAPPLLQTKVPNLSLAIEQVVHKALSKEPTQRFTTVKDFINALEKAILGVQPGVVSPLPSQPLPPNPNVIIIAPTTPINSPGGLTPSSGATARLPQSGGVMPYRSAATLHVFKGHEGEVYSVTWSPDSQRIASASSDRTVRVWNIAARSIDAIYKNSRTVKVVAWSPDGTHLASMNNNQIVQVRNALTGDILVTYTGHLTKGLGIAFALAWSPDGTYLTSGSDNNKVHVWLASSGSDMYSFYGHESWITAVAWSPDGWRIASGSEDRTMQVWDAFTGKKVLTYESHTGEVSAVAWSPNGKLLASGSSDKIKVWDATDKDKLYATYEHHKGVNAIAWSPDSKYLASAGNDRTVEIWDSVAKQKVFTYIEHLASVRSVAWSPDGKYLASADEDKRICLWKI